MRSQLEAIASEPCTSSAFMGQSELSICFHGCFLSFADAGFPLWLAFVPHPGAKPILPLVAARVTEPDLKTLIGSGEDSVASGRFFHGK